MNQVLKVINNIPVIEFYPNIGSPIGVFFLVHGHTCSKDPMYFGSFPQRLTDIGYLVVSIDAYKHGERTEEPYLTGQDYEKAEAMLEVIQKTCIDINYLYENIYQKIGGKLGILGISMGGHIVFQMPKHIHKIDILIPLIGSPDLKRHYLEMKSHVINGDRMKGLNQLFSILNNDYSIYNKSTFMLILEGKNDMIVSYRNALDFYTTMKNMGYHNIEYIDYPVGHVVTNEMENDVMIYITKHSVL